MMKKICIIAIVLSLIHSRTCYAVSRSMSYVNLNPCTTCKYEPTPVEIEPYRENYNRYYCDYLDNLYLGRIVSINAYDSQGRPIVPYSELSLVKFKSGTWIGMNLREQKQAIWNISDRHYYEDVYVFMCGRNLNSAGEAKAAECQAYATCIQKVAACAAAATQAAAAAANGGGNVDIPPVCAGVSAADCGPKPADCETFADCVTDDAGSEKQPYYYQEIPGNKICATKNTTYCDGYSKEPFPEEATKMEIPEIISCTARMVHKTVDRAVTHVINATIQADIILDTKDRTKATLESKSFTNSKLLIDKEKAKEEHISATIASHQGSSFDKVKEDVEDPDEKKTKLPKQEIYDMLEKIENNEEVIDLTPYFTGEYHSLFEYGPDNVCINVKNSNVFYDTHNKYSGLEENDCKNESNSKGNAIKYVKDEQTEDNEELQETVDYWHYFIPLDTHTTSAKDKNDRGFYIGLTDGKEMDGEYCAQILSTYPINPDLSEEEKQLTYRELIRPKDATFNYDYYGESTPDSLDYQTVLDNGCYFSVQIRFNVEQKFYGEVLEEKKGRKQLVLKGYGFYYRPIDIFKPFPNPIATDSIWNGLYNEAKNQIVVDTTNYEVNIGDSFEELTYTTQEVSINEIREATSSGKEYTSWEEMELNGQNPFVKEFDLRRNVDMEQIYALGCGPDNLDWEEGECNK